MDELFKSSPPKPSPIQKVCVDGFELFVKRDDLLNPDFQALSGNKARKFQWLLESDVDEIKGDKVKGIVSYGSAQGNGLVALAAIAKLKGLAFDYYVDHIGEFLKQHPAGNYQQALSLGARIIEVKLKANGIDKTLEQYVVDSVNDSLADSVADAANRLYVPEGGANAQAAVGVYQLADELMEFFDEQQAPELKVMLPSGTGTMAWFLQQRFAEKNYPVEVWTCACVGGGDYLLAQFKRFEVASRLNPLAPIMLDTPKKFHFGKLYGEFWQMWQRVYEQTGIEFELLYDPLGWICLLDKLKSAFNETAFIQTAFNQTGRPLVVYIHQGGVLGNQTMLSRYRRKFI